MNWECIYCDKTNEFTCNVEGLSSKKNIYCKYCNLINFHNYNENTDIEKIRKHISRYKKINNIVDSIPYSQEEYPSNYVTYDILLQCCFTDNTYIIPQVTQHIVLEHIKYRLYIQRKLKWDNYRRKLCKKKYLELLRCKILYELNNDIIYYILKFL